MHYKSICDAILSRIRAAINSETFLNQFKELLDITVRTYYLFTQLFNLWNGYHLFAIDGTRVHMPYSESVETDFGFQGDGRYDRKHFMGLGSDIEFSYHI